MVSRACGDQAIFVISCERQPLSRASPGRGLPPHPSLALAVRRVLMTPLPLTVPAAMFGAAIILASHSMQSKVASAPIREETKNQEFER